MLNIPDDDFDNLNRQNSVQSDLLNFDDFDNILRTQSANSERSDYDKSPKELQNKKKPFDYIEEISIEKPRSLS